MQNFIKICMITTCHLLFEQILKVGNVNQQVRSDVLFYSIKNPVTRQLLNCGLSVMVLNLKLHVTI